MFKKWFTLGVMGLALAVSVDAAKRPNIIMVLIDDMGWPDLSCFGNEKVSTPAIDQLASEGILFEQFSVSSPICSPSRVAITTGQYPQRWRITSYLDNAHKNAHRGLANWLDLRAPVLARMLQQAGYRTGHFGKWHMGGQRDVAVAPDISEYGFDESLTNFEGMGPKLLPLTLAPEWDAPRKIWEDAERLGGPYTWTMRSEITSGFVDAALNFIQEAEDDDEPFFVNVWPDDVHGPWFPTLGNWKKTVPDRYLSVLLEMDRQLAPLFDHVRSSKSLRDNSLIVFCSDNGADPKTFNPSDKPFRGSKATLYEGGVRSPLIVWGPGLLNRNAVGTRNNESVLASIDLAPSLLSLAGASVSPGVQFDGEDVSATLLGNSTASHEGLLFCARPPDFKEKFGSEENLPDLSVRQGRWKLLCNRDGGSRQLYDIFADAGEEHNQIDARPEFAEELTAKVLEWYQSVQ